MSESRDISLRVFRFYAYVLVSFLLAIPLLLWPLSLVVQLESSFAVTIANNWAVSVAVMLLAVTVIDSFFSGAKSSGQLLAHVAWVVVTTAVLSKIIYASNSAYLLGLMFFTHSFRSSSCFGREKLTVGFGQPGYEIAVWPCCSFFGRHCFHHEYS